MQCRPHYSLKELSNQVVDNVFCYGEAGRTCCDMKDTLKLRLQIESAKSGSEGLS